MSSPTSIFRSPDAEAEVLSLYDEYLARWPVAHSEHVVPTRFGEVHVVSSGAEDGAPVLALHAASMAATSWMPNVAPLAAAGFRVFAVDSIGEANKSRLDDLATFPKTGEQIGDLHVEIAEELGIGPAPVVAASAGGHAALRFALRAPERVTRLALLGPMGITPLGLPAALRMMMVSMFPTDRRVERTTRWAIGTSPAVIGDYGRWFSAVLRSVASPPRVGRPVALQPAEMRRITMPVLLVLGDDDNLVGDPARAANRAAAMTDVDVHTLASSHLVGVERADEVNPLLVSFLEGGGPR